MSEEPSEPEEDRPELPPDIAEFLGQALKVAAVLRVYYTGLGEHGFDQQQALYLTGVMQNRLIFGAQTAS